jgi:hypothetical protein
MPSLAVRCQVRGLKEMNAHLDRIPANVNREAKITMGKAMLMVESTAIDNVNKSPPGHPQVDTGRLITSFTTEVELVYDVLTGRTGTDVEYAPDLEYGHIIRLRTATYLGVSITGSSGFVPAYPFLGPAFHEHKEEIAAMFEDAISRGLNTVS